MTYTLDHLITELDWNLSDTILGEEIKLAAERRTCQIYGLIPSSKALTDAGRVMLIQQVAVKEFVRGNKALDEMMEYERCLARER